MRRKRRERKGRRIGEKENRRERERDSEREEKRLTHNKRSNHDRDRVRKGMFDRVSIHGSNTDRSLKLVMLFMNKSI